jgi:uncharacterized protein YidB (DUF937 family)
MGLLDELLGGMMGGAQASVPGRDRASAESEPAGAGSFAPVLKALLPVVLAMMAGRAATGGRGGGSVGAGGGGGLGDILGQVLGGGQGGARGGGSLGDLLDHFQRAGYGDQARSWVSTGRNMPISPEAMEEIFGKGGMGEIARRAGVSERDASRGLSELMPEVVDRMTPKGEVPDTDSLVASVDALTRRLGLA